MATQGTARLGDLLKQFRLAAGLTQEELADRAGVSARSVSDLERGLSRTPRPSTIRRLVDALELTPAQRTMLLLAAPQEDGANPSPTLAAKAPTRHVVFPLPRLRVAVPAAVCLVALALGGLVMTLRAAGSSSGTGGVHSTARAPIVLGTWGSPTSPSGRPATPDGVIAAALPAPNGTGYALAFGATITVLRFSVTGQQLSSWTIPGTKPDDLIRVGDGKVDTQGNLWVTTDQNDVREYSPDGQLLARWGGAGFSPNPGQFWYPLGLGLASNGEVVVGDAGSHRIQVLTAAGKPIRQWSGPGISPERLQNFVPRAIAMDRQDDVYVLDTGNFGVGNYQVERFSLQGKLLAILHPPGLRYGIGNCSPDLTTDSQGNVYVLDCGANKKSIRIDRFDALGRKLAAWTSLGSHPRVSGEMTIMRFNSQEIGYASVLGSPAVLKIDEAGHVLAAWTAQHLWQPLFRSPRAVAADQAGNVFVSDSGLVVRLSPGAQTVRPWRAVGVGISPSAPSDIAIDRRGRIVALDALAGRVVTYSASGRLLGTWGRSGSAPGDLVQPSALGVDGQGNIQVLDVGDNRVKTFSPSGGLIRWWSVDPYGQTSVRGGMAVNSQGDVYLAIDNRILELSPQGLPLHSWGNNGTGPERFLDIRGVAVDDKGNVYATDAVQNSLQVF
ncbi:MAG TPA: helix-turn-helix domain-containing protein, partial [Chloroflexota bacterium]